MNKFDYLKFSQDQAKLFVRPFYNKMLHVINCMITKFASSLQNVIFEKEKREERLVKLEQKKILNFLKYHPVSLIKTSLHPVIVAHTSRLHFALHNFVCKLFRFLMLNLNYFIPTQQKEKPFSRHKTTVLFSRGTCFESQSGKPRISDEVSQGLSHFVQLSTVILP
jgi:hypothetical protein